jgi:HSP20 family protein
MALRRQGRNFLDELNQRLNSWLPSTEEEEERSGSLSLTGWRPDTDIYEDGDDLVFEVEAPGLHKDDLDIQFDDGLLTISGQRREERDVDEGERDYYRTERFYGQFQRTFSLPQSVEAEDISARFEDGVLTVRAPHANRSDKQQISIS